MRALPVFFCNLQIMSEGDRIIANSNDSIFQKLTKIGERDNQGNLIRNYTWEKVVVESKKGQEKKFQVSGFNDKPTVSTIWDKTLNNGTPLHRYKLSEGMLSDYKSNQIK